MITEILIFYLFALFLMCFDNYMWIFADRKWYYTEEWKPHFKSLFILNGREYFPIPRTKEGGKIILGRIWDVIKHPYDFIPAIIGAFLLWIVRLLVL